MNTYRQGDLLFIQVDEVPEGKLVPREDGRLILARGEVTGHAHAVLAPHVTMIETTKSRFLVAEKPFDVPHEEHHAPVLADRVYEVRRQREYSPSQLRTIAD